MPSSRRKTTRTSLSPVPSVERIHTFDYTSVRLLRSMFKDQVALAREVYFGISNDSILKGFRRKAGLPAPGKDMGGWCTHSSEVIFGQLLSGMARLSKATGDKALRRKALRLMNEWAKTLPSLSYGHYGFDKYVCGLVDMYEYAGSKDARALLEKCTTWAISHLKRTRCPATDEDSQGGFFTGELEWYTLPENLYRAYRLTGNPMYRKFAKLWHYPHYWDMFSGRRKPAPHGFHGYSHVNTLSSAAMAYAVTGQEKYLKTLVNAYDYFRTTQCYATGGYGPGEKLMRPNGELGESIAEEPNKKFLGGSHGRTFETPCGTWAVFKICRYLQLFTGEARFGDWMEEVLYNGIGAALPTDSDGNTFYYADYRLAGGSKRHATQWPCCAGTYIQDVADYHNIIYYHDDDGLYVNLFVPSEVTWETKQGRAVVVTQTTSYPESDTTQFSLKVSQPTRFMLRFRVAEWSQGFGAKVNGRSVRVSAKPGSWATIERTWRSGDKIELRLRLEPRLVPIDKQHPKRVAMVCGPVVMVRVDDTYAPGGPGAAFSRRSRKAFEYMSQEKVASRFVPFYSVGKERPYRMYFDGR